MKPSFLNRPDCYLVRCCSIQLSIDVQLPKACGGLASKAIYIGEHALSVSVASCRPVRQADGCHIYQIQQCGFDIMQTQRAAS